MKKIIKSSFVVIVITVSVSIVSIKVFSTMNDDKLNKLILTAPLEDSSRRGPSQETK